MVSSLLSLAQQGTFSGKIVNGSETISGVVVLLKKTSFQTVSNEEGVFSIQNIPFGTYHIILYKSGYFPFEKKIELGAQSSHIELTIKMIQDSVDVKKIVVTGTKTPQRQTEAPVLVNLINSKTLNQIQACNLSEGLKFQPGLRVETDCQTCNYTQLRMNGLGGGYSQILINGRPIFSPITSLYGLEQIPVNMIDRIEVVRGGGSSLYGSSAIGGTVNVITKIPKRNSFNAGYQYFDINGGANDHQWVGNATLVSDSSDKGISFFFNQRNREFYDHNKDGFSELPKLETTSLGINAFILPKKNQKLEINLSYIDEYRFGGDMVPNAVHLTRQSEERQHNIWMGSADYQINFNQDKSSVIAYAAWQQTKRDHYTGIFPESDEDIAQHLSLPPYGTSDVSTLNSGLQVNHKFTSFLGGSNTFTFGTEWTQDKVFDEIPTYRYVVDQTTQNFGTFIQSNWKMTRKLTLLSGIRADIHNLIDQPILNPRVSLLYGFTKNMQARVSYGTGFRAPQAFDTDLHIAFAGGGVSRVMLSPQLLPEQSQSWTASLNYDHPMDRLIFGFTLEGFFTRLDRAFILNPIGADEFGEVFEKQNGQGATVQGGILELRMNYNKKIQLESGFTLQTSTYDNPVEYIDGIEGVTDFIRTPNQYGFASISWTPNDRISINTNYVFTGSMLVPHFAGAENHTVDEIITSQSFSEWSAKVKYSIPAFKKRQLVNLFVGVKNAFNAYQNDFDTGKNRDSNFVYGPSQPKTFFFGLSLSSR